MSWKLADDDDLMMLDEACPQCGFLLHYLRGPERKVVCIPDISSGGSAAASATIDAEVDTNDNDDNDDR